MKAKHPIQPLELDEHGVLRFKANAIVDYLLENGGIDMNQLAKLPFSQEDRVQFAQLIGYSHSGSGDLSYMDDETWETAAFMYEHSMTPEQAKIAYLTDALDKAKTAIGEVLESLGDYQTD